MNWLADQQLAELSLKDIKANFLREFCKALVEIKQWELQMKAVLWNLKVPHSSPEVENGNLGGNCFRKNLK